MEKILDRKLVKESFFEEKIDPDSKKGRVKFVPWEKEMC